MIRAFWHTSRAALMGPDDHRHSGERAAYGSRVWLSRRTEFLSHVPPGLRTLFSKRYMRQPGQKAVTGCVASPHPYRLVPFGRTTRPVRPLEFQWPDRKRGVATRKAGPKEKAAPVPGSRFSWRSNFIFLLCAPRPSTYMTLTLVPTFTRSYRSTTSSLRILMQPDDTAEPMVQGWLVP
jgi:hypothetical protein